MGPEQHTILLNLFRAVPEGGLEASPLEVSPSVAQLFTHIHYVRLIFVFEDAPEFARRLPEEEWVAECNPVRIAQMWNDSAKAVRDAVKGRVEAGQEMNLHYDHPILLLQHMIWHEGYHHGQIRWPSSWRAAPLPMREPGRSRGASGCARARGFKAFARVQRQLYLETDAAYTWTYSRITGT